MLSSQTPALTGRLPVRMVLPVLLIYYAMNYMDRSVLAIVGENMRLDLGLSDAQMGMCHSLLLISLIFLILPCSACNDVFGRRRMISLSATLWAGAMLLTDTASAFGQLAVGRFAAGINDACTGAGGSSWLAQIYPPQQRGRALGLFYMSSPLGMALGTLWGGCALAMFASWRPAFLLFVPMALMVAIIVPRLPDVPTAPSGQSYTAGVGALLGTRTILITGCATGLYSITQFAYQAWLPALLMRQYSLDGFWVALLAACMLLAGGCGSWLGGKFSDWQQSRSAYGRPVAAAMCLAAMALFRIFFYQTIGIAPLWLILLLGLVDGVLSVAPLPIFAAIVQDVAPTRYRNLAMGVMGGLSFLAGGAWGPLLGGLLSQYFGSGGAGLQSALTLLTTFGLGACVLMLAGARRYAKETLA